MIPAERDVRTIYTRDESSGMVHARVYLADALLSDEACNLDDAGDWREITEAEMRATHRDRRCKRCIPEVWPAL